MIRFDDSNKTIFNYIFFNILIKIYKISLKAEQ